MRNPKRRIVFTADARFFITRPAAPTADKIATVAGYAILWNVLSSDRGGFKVRLMPGSARFASPTHALWHHDFSKPLGDTVSGTLRLFTDAIGVRVEIDLPDTQAGRDAEELVESRRVRGMSFAMSAAPAFEQVTENGETVNNVTAFECDEVTVTPIPAFTQTNVDLAEDDEPEPARVAASLARNAIRFNRLHLGMLALSPAQADTEITAAAAAALSRNALRLERHRMGMLNR